MITRRAALFAEAYFESLANSQTNEPGSRDEDRLLRAVSAGDQAVCPKSKSSYRAYACGLDPGHEGDCEDK